MSFLSPTSTAHLYDQQWESDAIAEFRKVLKKYESKLLTACLDNLGGERKVTAFDVRQAERLLNWRDLMALVNKNKPYFSRGDDPF